MKSNFTLLRDLVMVLPLTEKTSKGGIVVVSEDKTAPGKGVVLSVGPDVKDLTFKDKVVYMRGEAREIKYEGDTILVVKQADILCKMID